MKRLVWLLLAAFCTALAQVPPVVVAENQSACDCCVDQPGACGMPDCAPLPGPLPARSLLPALEVRRTPAAARVERVRPAYSFLLVRPAARERAPIAAEKTARAAQTPLFKAHCSFLI
jgi:hypothetical protein